MLAASRRHPNLVCQLVPTSGSYRIDRALQRLLGEGFVGDVLSVEVQMLQRGFASFDGELDWRHDPEFSGINVLNVGGTYESAMRWLGPGNRVMAKTRVHIPPRRDEQGRQRAATIPDHVEVLYELAQRRARPHEVQRDDGPLAPAIRSGSSAARARSTSTTSSGSSAAAAAIRRSRSSPNPREQQAAHRVEEEFINAIRGREQVSMTTFETGVRYMEWTEAVHRSAASGAAVQLPLA